MEHILISESVDIIIFMYVSDCSKTQNMCDKAVEKDSKMLKFVPDYLKTQVTQLTVCKEEMNKELMPVASHLLR